jgi:hypothetical protein
VAGGEWQNSYLGNVEVLGLMVGIEESLTASALLQNRTDVVL